jgi:hypothetical protein
MANYLEAGGRLAFTEWVANARTSKAWQQGQPASLSHREASVSGESFAWSNSERALAGRGARQPLGWLAA